MAKKVYLLPLTVMMTVGVVRLAVVAFSEIKKELKKLLIVYLQEKYTKFHEILKLEYFQEVTTND